MIKIGNWIVFFSILIICGSCTESDEFLKGENQILYAAKKKLQFEGLLYSAKMKASYSSDTVAVEVGIKNVGEKPIELNFIQAQLLGQNGIRSNIIATSTERKMLKVGESTIDTIYFNPINDMDLYKNTDLMGALNNEYFLLPAAIGGMNYSSAHIKLIASESSYKGYLNLRPYSGISIYNIDKSEALKADLMKRVDDLITFSESLPSDVDVLGRKPKPLVPDVRISRKEILITGIASLVKLYERDGKTILIWRLLNHQGASLQVNPEAFYLLTPDGKKILPEKRIFLERPPSWNKEKNRLLKGERMGFQFVFESQNAESLTLVPSVKYGEDAVLFNEIPLKKFIEPNQE